MLTVHRYESDVYVVKEALSSEECGAFIAQGEAVGFEAATVAMRGGPQMLTGIRNNDRVTFEDEALAASLWERMEPYAPSSMDGFPATGLNPRFRIYRYEPGQRFKRHKDGRVRLSTGEVSRVTLLFYLNADCTGGDTYFADHGFGKVGGGIETAQEIRVSPEAGSALFFTHERWHEGQQVTAGKKYVLRTDVLYAGEPDTLAEIQASSE